MLGNQEQSSVIILKEFKSKKAKQISSHYKLTKQEKMERGFKLKKKIYVKILVNMMNCH